MTLAAWRYETRSLCSGENQRLDRLSPAFVFGKSCQQHRDAGLEPAAPQTIDISITSSQPDGGAAARDNGQPSNRALITLLLTYTVVMEMAIGLCKY